MKDKWQQIRSQAKEKWMNSTTKQKLLTFGSIVLFVFLIAFISWMTTAKHYVPLYKDLSVQEVGQIKAELDGRGIPYELGGSGTTISVPEEQSDQLIVELAAQGIPKSGSIDYSFFSENASWGITDNEFNMMKLDAMQTELANLIKGIEGIEDAKVMINLPEQTVFVADEMEQASASIVLHTQFGQEFQDNQIQSLYHLVSKAVPDLPAENIVIMNQYFEYYDQVNQTNTAEGDFSNQQAIKREIEKDIQKRLQQMLGTVVGMDKVITSVTADIDFSRENRVEELVEPVDVENMEGIPVSIENIQETFDGSPVDGGIVGTGEEDIANYPGTTTGQEGDYEHAKETVNYELNRIHRDIAEAPYKIRDIGIQVVVDNVRAIDGDQVEVLSQQEQNTVEEGIASILNSMVTTSIDKEYGEIEPNEKVSIVFQQFNGRALDVGEDITTKSVPIWIYILAVVLMIVIIIVLLTLRKRKAVTTENEVVVQTMAVDQAVSPTLEPEVPNIAEQPKTETDIQKDQLEKMAKDNPEDFAKLLRSWISEE